MSRTHRALLLVALAQLAIGAAAVFARFALTASGPLAVSAARLAVGATPLLVLAALRGRLRPIDGPTERRLGLAGLLLAAHFALWIASLDFASVALSTLLVCSSAIWTEAYAVLRRGRIDPYAAFSVLGALAGVAIVVGLPDRANTPLGIGLAIGGAIAIAAYLIVVRATDPRYDTLAVTSRTYTYAAVALSAAALVAHDHLPPAGDLGAWGGILAIALLSQLFGHTALNAAVRVLSPTFVSTMTLLEPVVAAALAAWLFAERLGPTTAIGAAVILGAIAIALRGESRSEVLTNGTERVKDERGGQTLMAAALSLPDLGHLEAATEIVPPHWLDDDDLIALQEQYPLFMVERFADGTLLVTPPPSYPSGTGEVELIYQVTGWARRQPASLRMNGGVHLPDGSLFGPDMTYASPERWKTAPRNTTFAHVVPDAAFEMLSKSDRIAATRRKLEAYLRNGVGLAVLIDCKRRHVYVGREGEAEARDLGWIDQLDCSPAMPGFVLDLAAIYAAWEMVNRRS